jgi:hypothetical protein
MAGEEKGVSITHLIKLLNAAKKAGVSSLQLGDFRVEFKEDIEAKDSGQNLIPPAFPGPDAGLPEGEQQGSQINLFDDSEILEMEKSQQLIDDPAGFEIDQIRTQIENQRLAGEQDEKAQA